MKYLIDGNFVAVLKGEFVRVQSDDQFVIETEELHETQLTIGQLVEIAKSNDIQINETKKSKIVSELENGLNSIRKIKEVDKMTDSQKAEEIIEAAHEAGKDENETLVELVTSGIPFKKAGKLYMQTMIQLGFLVSTSDRKTQMADFLAKKEIKAKEYSELLSIVAAMQTEIAGLTSAQALSGIRKFAKENQIELPKKPKAEKKAKGGFKTQLIDWICDNPTSTQKELEDYVVQNNKKESMAKRYSAVLEVANRVAGTAVES